ncbi:peroxidase [Anabrus simplex]|uniref:peroxidase n=1 Tax=Anabrus simplex TaxID=316456 RepID=UPI0035A28E23
MKKFFIFCVVCCALTGIRARNCAENIVQMFTRRQAPWCGSRIEPDLSLRDLSGPSVRNVIQQGRSEGLRANQREMARERNIVERKRIIVQHSTPEYHHYLFTAPLPGFSEYFNKSTRDLNLARETSKALVRAYDLPKWAAGDVLTLVKIPAEPDSCSPTPTCNSAAIYRTYDGSCNNLQNPKWGMSDEPFTRLLPSVFDDGIYSIRTSVVDGSPLPSERKLRTSLILDRDVPDYINLLVVMQWGQIVAHDTLASIDSACYGGFGCMCCQQNGQYLAPEDVSRACYVVDVPPDDYKYGPYNKRCMGFGRGNSTFALNCRLSASENINNPSAYLDGSLVYGLSESQARSLRELRGGRLTVSRSRNREMLPRSNDSYEDCDVPNNEACYIAGDGRVNQNPQLTILQTVLLRLHNDIARKLQQLNPRWDDERLYQEARRIVIAIIQHITYNEMVPIYLGRKESLIHDLLPLARGYNMGYNPNVNAQIINSHTGAAYRGVHGIAQGELAFVDEARCPLSTTPLSNWYTRPSIIEQSTTSFDNLLLGLVTQPSQKADKYSTTQLTDNLFKRNGWGQDLGTLDIARGRERGIPCYNDYRELCGLRRARSFQDFTDYIDISSVRTMASLYKDVDDVDLYVGGFLETPLPDTIFGPTFHCIVKEQFYRTKFGDRFFYEFPTSRFTQSQLNSIRQVTFSSLVCHYGNNITKMQPRAFEKISDKRNPLMPCSSIPSLDLTAWRA